jgi:hypothetical protein
MYDATNLSIAQQELNITRPRVHSLLIKCLQRVFFPHGLCQGKQLLISNMHVNLKHVDTHKFLIR